MRGSCREDDGRGDAADAGQENGLDNEGMASRRLGQSEPSVDGSGSYRRRRGSRNSGRLSTGSMDQEPSWEMQWSMSRPRSSVISADSLQSLEQAVCVPARYTVPKNAVRRGLQRLDSVHSPGMPGLLRTSLVTASLRRFDLTFDNRRSETERLMIVESLEFDISDYTRVWWNSEPLLSAFHVVLNLQERIYFTVDVADSSTLTSRVVSFFMVCTILASIGIWMVGTMSSVGQVPCQGCQPEPPPWMKAIDDVCVCIFSAEYLVRLLTVGSVRHELLQSQILVDLLAAGEEVKRVPLAHGPSKLFKFVRSPAAIFDFLTVLPYWIELIFQSERAKMPFLRIFRLLRVSRVFKLFRLLNSDLGQLSDAHALLVAVLRQAFPAFFMTLVLVLSALVVFSVLMYTVERGEWYPGPLFRELEFGCQGDDLKPSDGQFVRTRRDGSMEISPFDSIPAAAWWTLATITTVGYGDAVPVTAWGKMVGFVAILYGTVLLGLPIGIIGSQFSMEFGRMAIVSRRRVELVRERAAMARRRQMKKAGESNVTVKSVFQNGLGSSFPQVLQSSKRALGPRSMSDSPAVVEARKSTRKQLVNMDMSGDHAPDGEEVSAIRHASWSEIVYNRMTTTFIPKSKEHVVKAAGAAVEDVAHPQPGNLDSERLRHVKHNFEDAVQTHGESTGITADQQLQWSEDLMAIQFSACPALDRLGIRVLTTLSEAEQVKPTAADAAQEIRIAWLELCISCCRNSENMEAERLREQHGSGSVVISDAGFADDDAQVEQEDLRPEEPPDADSTYHL